MKRKTWTILLRIVIFIISCIMIFWYTVSTIFNIGTVAGSLFFAWTGANCILWDKVSSVVFLIIILLDAAQRHCKKLCIFLCNVVAALYKHGILGT